MFNKYNHVIDKNRTISNFYKNHAPSSTSSAHHIVVKKPLNIHMRQKQKDLISDLEEAIKTPRATNTKIFIPHNAHQTNQVLSNNNGDSTTNQSTSFYKQPPQPIHPPDQPVITVTS